MDLGRPRFPTIPPQSPEVAIPKVDSKSVAYEIRTKSGQSGGLETNEPRERIFAPDGLRAVRRFEGEARGYWRFQRAQTRRRKLLAVGLAEGEELSSNSLLICNSEKY